MVFIGAKPLFVYPEYFVLSLWKYFLIQATYKMIFSKYIKQQFSKTTYQ